MDELTITRPDDWHLHVRDGAVLQTVVPFSARMFGRAIIMPNLKPPVTSATQAAAYRERILAAVPAGSGFQPLMTLYLTDRTTPRDIGEAARSGIIHGVKLYPAGATTHSDAGVTDLARLADTLDSMTEHSIPLLVHGEVTDPDVDVFDREAVFIERVLAPLTDRHPNLRIVLEHVTTAEAVEFVRTAPANVGATITPQHLLHNRNALFKGGLRPHAYCLPVLKRERHRAAVLEAAISGSGKFFLGTDSAPHARRAKESACGCAGIFSAPTALALYASVFEHAGALDRLEQFACHAGADFYGLPRNRERIRLRRAPWQVPEHYPLADAGHDTLVPIAAGEVLQWVCESC